MLRLPYAVFKVKILIILNELLIDILKKIKYGFKQNKWIGFQVDSSRIYEGIRITHFVKPIGPTFSSV